MAEKLSPPNPPPSDGVVRIRPFRAEDAPAIAAACQDPQVPRWIPLIPVPYTEVDARRFILVSLQAWNDGSGYEFAIADARTDRYVGSVGIQPGSNPRRHAVGYMVAPEMRGHGIATRGLRLAVRWAFESLAVERLALWTLPGNVASQRVAEKAGFRWEGIVRNWDSGRDGQPLDVVMFSMTPDDLADAIEADAEETADGDRVGSGAAGGGASGTASGAAADSTKLRIAPFPRELPATGTRGAAFIDVVAVADLGPDSIRRVTLAGVDLLVASTPDGIVVTDDRCPHMSAPLSIGELRGCVVSCPLHEGSFNLSTGETVQMPTTGGLDADGNYHSPWSPSGSRPKAEQPSKKLEARRLTRIQRLRYYPARIRGGRLEAQIPSVPE
jgi:RimJ/RimL family protein N-acetyltransferase/nitrite reductase/ring-hydroxylating ferredoxin subunit